MGIYEPYVKAETSRKKGKFTPRPEQSDAIDRAFKYFKKNEGKGAEFLWNAKMRFGKTVCALWLIEKLNKELGKKKVLIVTHRPVVNASWYGDFKNLFKDSLNEYSYGTAKETDDESGMKDFYDIRRDAKNGKCVLFFVSMQYLRLSKLIGGKKDDSQEKKDILNYDWDLVIIDEAHEGTQTDLGEGVINYLHKNGTFMLHLSGTPFNLLDKFKSEQIYNWDYIKEQQYKRQWDEDYKNKKASKSPSLFDAVDDEEEEVNPYRELPRMEILTFRLGEMTDEQAIKDAATGEFSFTEFFRVKTGHDVPKEERGKFLHEEQVLAFIKKLCQTSTDSHYPFSNDDYRKCFRHTLWVVPGVKEAQALKKLLERTPLCTKLGFKVVNVAGNSEDDEQRGDALDKVLNAIGIDKKSGIDDSDQTRTITLSCGRLTTGVTVRPWTAVLYLKGSDTTAASTYMQTIFRVQSPHTINGMMKSKCYVFDFAPERALTMMAETAKYSRAFERKEKKGEKKQKAIIDKEDKEKMKELLNECPIYETTNGSPVINNGRMQPIATDRLFSQLNRVYTDKVVRNGFDHPSLYDNDKFLNMELEDEFNLNYIDSMFGDESKSSGDNDNRAVVNHQDDSELTPEQIAIREEERKKREEAARKAREEAEKKYAEKLAKMTPEEREAFLKEKEENARKKKLQEQSRDKLHGLSVRIPLMMYGANVEDFKEVTIETFTQKRFIDDESWNEFMPKGVSRELFRKLSKFYNPDVFRDAGVRIRQLALEADSFKVEERIARIAQIFKWFKNPDKETVLTPWEVVNRHMSCTLGGYCFFDEDFKTPCTKVDPQTGEILSTTEPRFVDHGEVTKKIFGDGTLGNIDEKAGSINTKVLEINSKTGLYPLYVAYSLYRHLLPVYAGQKGLMADNPEDYSADDEHVIWDEVVKNNLYVICNTKMAERITRRTLLGFRKRSDGSDIKLHVKQDKLITRVGEDKDALITDLLSDGYWNNSKMRKKDITFNAVVGNPPYQVGDGSGASDDAANPIYQEFVKVSQELQPQYVSIIMPSKWMIGGKAVLKPFRKQMMEDRSISKLYDFENDQVIFPNAHNDGGICFFLWDKEYDGLTKYSFYPRGGNVITSNRSLNDGGFEIVIRDNRRGSIISKTSSINNRFTEIVSKTKPFGIRKDVFNNPEKYSEFNVQSEYYDGSLMIHGVKGIKGGAKRTIGYIHNSAVSDENKRELINKYKVFFTTSYSSDATIPPEAIEAEPGVICTETFLVFGPFETKEEMQNCHKYVQTTFFRLLLYFGHGTMQVSQEVFRFIPLQDFTNSSDIDWTKPVNEIDNELFDKYKFDELERQFISNIFYPIVPSEKG